MSKFFFLFVLVSFVAAQSTKLLESFFKAAKADDVSRVENLLRENPDKLNVNSKNKEGRTALMITAWRPDMNVFMYLLAQDGIGINLQRSKNGNTALMAAASQGRMEKVNNLLDHGAITFLTNNNGETAAMLAKNNEIEKRILEHGAPAVAPVLAPATSPAPATEPSSDPSTPEATEAPQEDQPNSSEESGIVVSEDDTSGFSTGPVIGFFFALVCVLGIAMIVVRRKRSDEQSSGDKEGSSAALSPLSQADNSIDHPSMLSNAVDTPEQYQPLSSSRSSVSTNNRTDKDSFVSIISEDPTPNSSVDVSTNNRTDKDPFVSIISVVYPTHSSSVDDLEYEI